MIEYEMMGHIYMKVPKNTEWLKEGCIPNTPPPEYIKNITFEDLERSNND